MKNLFIGSFILMTICFISACGHKTTSVGDPIIEQIDSIAVDTCVCVDTCECIDTCACDTVF